MKHAETLLHFAPLNFTLLAYLILLVPCFKDRLS
jgi:hypothetical protein